MTNTQTSTQISGDRRSVRLTFDSDSARYHALWLRDNVDVAKQPGVQKNTTVLTYPDSTTIGDAVVDDKFLTVTFLPENIQCHFPLDWLQVHRYDKPGNDARTSLTDNHIVCWDAALDTDTVTQTYTNLLQNPEARLRWFHCIHSHGFGILRGLDGNPGELLDVTALFGYPRETNYGKVFEVRSEINPANLAYSSLPLQAHTDNPYRDPAPTLQILSCLQNNTEGGHSIVVDGFQAATTLYRESTHHFALLSQYNAVFNYAGHGDVSLSAKKPMLELNVEGVLQAIRFNNRSVAPLTEIPFEHMEDYYAAYRHLADIIERSDVRVVFKLEPGELFMVDNRRVLHGRTGYDSAGSRWLQGCYPDIDGLHSTIRLLQHKLSASAAETPLPLTENGQLNG